jgi:DNA polymerase I-like protein with 3'-5' exonuclease and polymerase domains
MNPKVPSFGPQPARILIVGEAPGASEVEEGKPFVGSSGYELTKMLQEAGILRSEVRITNVCKYRPPQNKIELWAPKKKKDIGPGHQLFRGRYFDARVVEGIGELEKEIEETQPNVIVPLGNLALWATTGEEGILKWRSSLLQYSPSGYDSRGRNGPSGGNHQGDLLDTGSAPRVLARPKVIPTIHPAAVLRTWEWRFLAVHDFRRVKRWQDFVGYPEIKENFLVGTDYNSIVNTRDSLLSRVRAGRTDLAVDIETGRRHLACLGIAWSESDAICIPFADLSTPQGYFSEQQERDLILLLRELLTHPNAKCIGQNWQYDYQYIARYWGFEVNLDLDIMTEHHTQFPGLPKGLDFQSSLYRDIHVYWKDEGKEMGKGSVTQWWTYNCRDCVATWEIAKVLRLNRIARPLRATVFGTPNDIQQRLSTPYARASLRGIKINMDARRKTAFYLQEDIASHQAWINDVVGKPFNVGSPKQMHGLFYGELALPKILDRKTKKPTLNDQALEKIANDNLLLRPLCSAIAHMRSLEKFFQFCTLPISADGRFRCMFTIPGTETFRRSSSKDPFGTGTNMQNVSQGDRSGADFPLPNLRRLFVPDPGKCMGEFDLPQADARVVAWESGDRALMDLFHDPKRHLHKENAQLLFGYVPEKSDINYYYAKQGVHLTNYGGTPHVLAKTLNITVKEAEQFQARYFEAHKPIKQWHTRTVMELATRRYVENIFGFRRFYFDRVEGLLKEALAWIPQSTVGISTDLAMLAIVEHPESIRLGIEFLQQGHDSALFQWPIAHTNYVVPWIKEKIRVTLPYKEPLVFDGGLKISAESWGDVEEAK